MNDVFHNTVYGVGFIVVVMAGIALLNFVAWVMAKLVAKFVRETTWIYATRYTLARELAKDVDRLARGYEFDAGSEHLKRRVKMAREHILKHSKDSEA